MAIEPAYVGTKLASVGRISVAIKLATKKSSIDDNRAERTKASVRDNVHG